MVVKSFGLKWNHHEIAEQPRLEGLRVAKMSSFKVPEIVFLKRVHVAKNVWQGSLRGLCRPGFPRHHHKSNLDTLCLKKTKKLQTLDLNACKIDLPCCFLRALSQIAGLIVTGFPFFWIHRLLQTRTPKHDFLRILTLWLFVFRMAQPELCFLASSQLSA